MNESKLTPLKFFITLFIPLIIVTFGGFIVYQSPSAFFYPAQSQSVTESNGPAVIYYALTFVISLMYFLMKQQYRMYEFVALGVMSLIYSLSLKRMTAFVFRPIHLYLVPLLVFFLLIWAILKYIFINQYLRHARLILFTLTSSAAFTFAFWLQYTMVGLKMEESFFQNRFFSGIMLFVFVGFGLSVTEFFISRIEQYLLDKQKLNQVPAAKRTTDDEDEDN